jgi:hypothetical protein
MNRAGLWLRAFTASMCLGAAWGAAADNAADSCEREARWAPSATAHYFVTLAASQDVFYDGSGPSFVLLMRTDAVADESETGAVGVYADEKHRAVFGSVPRQTYDTFLHEPGKRSSNVMLRLEISQPQYERILAILRSWDRRAREHQLLYKQDVFMNNILLVKQATEALNECRRSVDLYTLDWGTEDRISDEHPRSYVPFLVFEEMKRRNASLHVPDSRMPQDSIRSGS